MKTVRRLMVLLVASVLFATTVYAADIDKMTLDELKKAYRELESENEKLEKENKELKAQLFDLQNGNAETVAETEKAESEESVLMTTEEFLKDIYDSYETRSRATERYTEAELNTMTEDESVEAYNTY